MTQAPLSTPKIRLQNVAKSFGSNQVLRNVTLDVMPGESLVILGGSGSGKSVLLKCILGLLPADQGSILIDGLDMRGAKAVTQAALREHMSILFQGSALFDSLPVWENIAFGLLQRGLMSRSEAHTLAIEKLAAVGLKASIADLYPAELSGGMQRRAALARAIAIQPDIIFFDEPTTGLDPIMSNVINELIVKVIGDMGACAITITHDLHSARAIAHRVALLYQGTLVWHGPVEDMDKSGNPYMEQFIHGRAEGPIKLDIPAE